MNNSNFQYLPPEQRIAEIERIRDGGINKDGKRFCGNPVDHQQYEKINEQIEQIRERMRK